MDLVFPNSHGYIERGPTWIYTQAEGEGSEWPRRELPNDSGWMSRVMDVDGDGYPDLIVVNGENGVTSELDSYVYWGGPQGSEAGHFDGLMQELVNGAMPVTQPFDTRMELGRMTSAGNALWASKEKSRGRRD